MNRGNFILKKSSGILCEGNWLEAYRLIDQLFEIARFDSDLSLYCFIIFIASFLNIFNTLKNN